MTRAPRVEGRRVRRLGLAAALLTTVLLAACDPPKPANDCAEIPGLDKWTWVGGATDSITNKAKWHHPGEDGIGFPGARTEPAAAADDYVCVPDDRHLVIREGQSLHIQVLDNQGTTEIIPGGRLDLEGNDTDRISYSNIMVLQGMLAGPGTLTTVAGGELHWQKTINGGTSMRSDEDLSPSAPPAKTVIAEGGTLRVSPGGVQLANLRTIVNHGTTQVVGNSAYIALDDGTSFVNLGTFDFLGDGDVLQGSFASPRDLPLFRNEGQVRKLSGGSGQSTFDVPFQRVAPGSQSVTAGRLGIWHDTSITASVALGARFGTGACGAGANATCTSPVLNGTQPQFAEVQRATGAGSPATVSIAEVPGLGEPLTKGDPVDLTAPAASNANPMTIRLGIDSTLTGGLAASALNVTHDGGANLPDCPASLPIAGACVDRAASTGDAGDDVVMVVKTPSNGRWRIR